MANRGLAELSLTFVPHSKIDCTGDSSPEVPAAGIDNFQANGIYGLWQGFYCWNGTLPTGIGGAPPTTSSDEHKHELLSRDDADGYFYYCSLPGFGGACSTTPYLSKQCSMSPFSSTADLIRYAQKLIYRTVPVPDSYNGAVQAATPVVNYNAACFVYQ